MKFKSFVVLGIIVFGAFLRFYNLNWGAPFYFHPDERQNIAYPILASKSLFMLDQQNFDTGTFPLLIIKIVFSLLTKTLPSFAPLDQLQLVILISRNISAIISVCILLSIFLIVRKIFSTTKAYFALIFATFSTGFIQFSHFGTIELWEALFFLLLFFYSWKIAKYTHKIDAIICGVLLGFSVSTKIFGLIVIPAIILSFLISSLQHLSKENILLKIKKIIIALSLFIVSAGIAFTITSLPLINNFEKANGSIQFESNVALGKIPVFYTRSFIDTTPVIFQFTKIYPYILNPLIALLLIPSLFSIIFLGFKNKNYAYLLLATYYLLIFVTQSIFFVKWTRYMIPTLPFVYIITGVTINDLLLYVKKRIGNTRIFIHVLATFPIIVSFLFSIAFFSIYLRPDVRISASNWIENSLTENSTILVESGNVIDIPLRGNFKMLSPFFYNFETDVPTRSEIISGLVQADYFIIQSRRVFINHQRLPELFPKTTSFYDALFNGDLGFKEIKEFNSFPSLGLGKFKIEFPDEKAEETWSVFDHPVIRIFKKTQQLSAEDYEKFLGE